ncbi:hypothetical protein DEU34_0554 [Microbacterium sp. AG1240]|uniref:hypothetical protein n=1 Tax=Microbacterium sp. AG1240 TaxID=2183992 RepID=UPI000EB34C9B|nr:hypothetical protein [Microbacterium sp. AG1240]RKT36048.1 hypothetical protein DEU34_0554 [Microbacterium sp. AG1240]
MARTTGGGAEVPPPGGRRVRGRAWTVVATVLIVVGALLAPVAAAAAWANTTLTDTDRFVETYAPLARDPAVRAFVTDETVRVISEQVDIAQLTSDAIDGIIGLGTGPVAAQALEAVKGSVAEGLESLVRSKVGDLVASEGFETVWTNALRITHVQLTAALEGDPDALVDLADDGSIGIQLAPIVDAATQMLVSDGFSFADRIPATDRVIVVAQSDALPAIQRGNDVVVVAGAWLPWIVLLLIAAGVAVARRRWVALMWAGIAVAATMTVLVVALAVVGAVVADGIVSSNVPAGVVDALLGAAFTPLREAAVLAIVGALVAGVVGWVAGPWRVPRMLQGLALTRARGVRAAVRSRTTASR